MLPGRMPITGGDSPVPRGTWKVSAVTGRSFTESRPTSATSGRVRKRSGVTGAPRQITEWTLHVARSSSSTMSARWPGATSPRSNRPKWRAADQVAAR